LARAILKPLHEGVKVRPEKLKPTAKLDYWHVSVIDELAQVPLRDLEIVSSRFNL
jgi:hypothetical protein